MAALHPGESLLVMATDPEAPIDLAAWAAEEGHGYEQRELEGWMEFVIRKRAAPVSEAE
jgi:TusA-related sulfurtransferase